MPRSIGFGAGARIALGLVTIGWPLGARAQLAEVLPPEPPQFPGTRYMAVMDRPQPALDPLGIHLGGWRLDPSLTVQGIADDNLFGVDRNRQAAVGLSLQPAATLQSNWGRNLLSVSGGATIDRYARFASENVANFDVSALGRLDISHATTVRAGIRYRDTHLSRQSVDLFAQPLRPVHYRVLSAGVAATQDFGRLRLSTGVDYIRSRYNNGLLPDGGIYLQATNDSDIARPSVKLAYAPSPALAVFVKATGDWRRFRVGTPTTPRRDSQGYELLGGVKFEPAALVRGSIGIGYIRQDFRDARYRPVAGPAFNADIQLFPTQLTTVSLHADRQVLDSGIPGSGGYLATTASAGIDHELTRQWILSATAQLERDRFNTIDRVDDRFSTAASALYRLSRTYQIQARYEHVRLKSAGADAFRSFGDNRLTLGVTIRR